MKADIVWIGGEAFSPNHPKVKEMKTAKQHNAEQCGEIEFSVGAVQPAGHADTALPGKPHRRVSPEGPYTHLSTDEAKLNKTERKFYEYLRSQDHIETVFVQAMTFKLADDCRYTPDFITHEVLDGYVFADRFVAYEVKGFWRDDAKVKIKVAARMFPIRFVVVQLIKGQWQFIEVKP